MDLFIDRIWTNCYRMVLNLRRIGQIKSARVIDFGRVVGSVRIAK